MPLDQFATEIEPQPRPGDLSGPRILRPHEASKDARLEALRNADAPITHREQRGVWLALLAQDHLDRPSSWTVLHRIAQQVGEHLLDTSPVDLSHQGGE